MTNLKLLIVAVILIIVSNLGAQTKADQIYIDNNGVMRHTKDKSELHGFGVNYTLPFAHEYRMVKSTGMSMEECIKQDVYHLARLDMDLYRVHIWDTEISDTLGNLINNEHLKLFDFTINEMKKRGIRFILTPIAYWGNGWPEPEGKTPGFSNKYGKDACLTNIDAIEAQANYLNQFLKHTNPYTGLAYKDDPDVIGFEISNEPHHREKVEKVTSFINKMVLSMRQTGCTKPIFYNMSHSVHLADAYLNANIQGGTFQWYPTNLVANHQINGNFLNHVALYNIPFALDPRFKKMAKIVYEFDPADVGGNIMYPAMARTFRETGMQLAAQFAYDAMAWAPYNTNYGTHYMNLVYTPQKAISLKIASAIFHHVKLYEKHSNPENFENFKLSYPNDLAEWVTNEKFFYSNNTVSKPSDVSQLKEIAGCGSSPIVKYNGTGAYFIDKIADGIWRLEVLPDVFRLDDPYSPASPKKQKTAILHSRQTISISLPNLEQNFSASPINEGNKYSPTITNGTFDIMPGVYLLKRNNVKTDLPVSTKYKNIKINEFVAPVSNLKNTLVKNYSPMEVITGSQLLLKLEIASEFPINKVEAVLSNGDKWKTVKAELQDNNFWLAQVPLEMVETGFIKYSIIVNNENDTTKFPGGTKGDPWKWDNRNNDTYELRVVPVKSPLILWDAKTDWETSYKIWNRRVQLKPTSGGETALSINLEKFPTANPLNTTEMEYAFKYYFKKKIEGRYNEISSKKSLCITVSNSLSVAQPLEIGLIDRNGAVLAGEILVTSDINTYKIQLSELKSASYLIIPRPYPEFLHYKIQTNANPFEWAALETLQLIVKPSNLPDTDLSIEKIWLE